MILISRPLYWLPMAGWYLVGMGKLSNFTWWSVLELLWVIFPLNLYLNGINDIYDAKSDKCNPRKGGVQGALLKKSEVDGLKPYLVIFPLIFVIISFFSANPVHILLSFLFIGLGFAYSHPSMRWKEVPIFDTFVGAAGCFLLSLIAFSSHASLLGIHPTMLLLIFPIMGLHAFSTLIDVTYDVKAGMNSTGIFLGEKKSLLFASVSFLIPLLVWYKDPFFLSVLGIAFCGCMALLVMGDKERKKALFPTVASYITLAVVALYYVVLSVNM